MKWTDMMWRRWPRGVPIYDGRWIKNSDQDEDSLTDFKKIQ